MYQDVAEQALRKAFKKCTNEQEVVDLAYNVGLAGLRSGNEAIIRKTLMILGHLAPIMNVGSKPGSLFELAKLSPNPVVYARVTEVDHAMAVARRPFDDLIKKIDDTIKQSRKHDSYKQARKMLAEADPKSLASKMDIRRSGLCSLHSKRH